MGHIFYSHLAHKGLERLIESPRPVQEDNMKPDLGSGTLCLTFFC